MLSYSKSSAKTLLTLSLLVGILALSPTATLASSISRLAGVTRYETARVIAQQFQPGSINDVVLATGNFFPDALSASVLAKKLNAPILLSDLTVEGSSEAFNYITEHLNKSGTIHIIGGTGIISTAFETKLNQMGYTHIERIGGYDCYDTNNDIAKKLAVPKNTPIVIAYGENFPDALSISSIASNRGWPVLLVSKDNITQSLKDYISKQQPSKVYIVGGTAVVSSSVQSQIQSIVPNSPITRLFGQDLFDTNAAILKAFNSNPNTLYLTTGLDFADALSGSILAAQTGDPIVLVDPNKPALPSPSIANYINDLHSTNSNPNITVFGGTAVVHDTTLKSVNDVLTGKAKPESVYSAPDITLTLGQYQNYTLPSLISVILYNSEKVDKPIQWDVGQIDTTTPGSKVATGTIDGFSSPVHLTLNVVAPIIKTTQYGTSGEGRPLNVTAMTVPNPTKVVLITFELHGWEDFYRADGQVLVNIGQAVTNYFTTHPNELKTTSLYVVSSANPDGLIDGWTNNGPGRTQISMGVDINRDFDYYWVQRTDSRNKTLAPFSSPEARALKSLVQNIHPTDVIDVHGWESTTIGSPELTKYFQASLGLGYRSGLSGASGYFTGWASMYAQRAALIELTDPTTSPSNIINALQSLFSN